MPSIQSVSSAAFETPLHNPFVTSRGSAASARAVEIVVTLDDGQSFRGESVPVTYVTGESIDTVRAAVSRIAPELRGIRADCYRQLFRIIAAMAASEPSARCGLEMAVLAAWSAVTGVHLSAMLGGAASSIASDVTIPIVPNAAELADLAWQMGMRVFKIKVGEPDIDSDYARVSAIRSAAPEARLRIDANQGFSPQAALDFITRLIEDAAVVELFEQPVLKEDIDGLDWVAQRSPVPVFADESCRTHADALRIVTSTCVHGLNLKINKNGIAGVLDMAAIARGAGRRLMLGCMLETSYSISVSLAIACGLGCFDYIDLDSHLLLDETVPAPLFDQVGPNMSLLA